MLFINSLLEVDLSQWGNHNKAIAWKYLHTITVKNDYNSLKIPGHK